MGRHSSAGMGVAALVLALSGQLTGAHLRVPTHSDCQAEGCTEAVVGAGAEQLQLHVAAAHNQPPRPAPAITAPDPHNDEQPPQGAQQTQQRLRPSARAASAAAEQQKQGAQQPQAAQQAPAAVYEGPANVPDVALCTAVKDAHLDIAEWVGYHLAWGVSKLYIFDEVEAWGPAGLAQTLAPFVEAGVVHVERRELARPRQQAAFAACLSEWGGRHDWMGFLEPNDFVVVADAEADIPQVLLRYEAYGGLAVSQRAYGASAAHASRAPPGATHCSTRAASPYTKTFAQPRYASGVDRSAHFLLYHEPYFAVDAEAARAEEGGRAGAAPTYRHLSVNHYMWDGHDAVVTRVREGLERLSRHRSGGGGGGGGGAGQEECGALRWPAHHRPAPHVEVPYRLQFEL